MSENVKELSALVGEAQAERDNLAAVADKAPARDLAAAAEALSKQESILTVLRRRLAGAERDQAERDAKAAEARAEREREAALEVLDRDGEAAGRDWRAMVTAFERVERELAELWAEYARLLLERRDLAERARALGVQGPRLDLGDSDLLARLQKGRSLLLDCRTPHGGGGVRLPHGAPEGKRK